MLIHQYDEILGEREVAVAWILEPLPRAARIHVIVQQPHATLEGASAQIPKDDRVLRFRNYYARMEARSGKIVTLDIGSDDGVSVRDVYEARDPNRPDYPIGRVVVEKVHEMSSEARIESEDLPFSERNEFVLSRGEASPSSVRIAVIPIQTDDPKQRSPAAARPPVFSVVAEALQQAKTLVRTFELLLHDTAAEPEGAPDDLLARIARRARSQRADQVVWISGSCTAESCAQAWHSEVPDDPDQPLAPEPLLLPSREGGAVVNDPAAVLGQISYTAGAFDEASYQLRSWFAGEATPTASHALIQLAEAESALGQLDRSRIWLREFADRSSQAAQEEQLLPFFRTWGRIACSDANASEVKALQQKVELRVERHPELKEVQLEALECSVKLSRDRGDQEGAQRAIEQGLALARELGDQASISEFEAFKGHSYELAGQIDKGREHLQQAFDAASASGDRGAQSQLGLALARNRMLASDFEGARKLAQDAMDAYKAMKNEAGIVECLPVLVRVHRRLYGTARARAFLTTERNALRRRRLPRAELALSLAGAFLDLQQGELARVGRNLKQLHESVRRQKLVDEEVQVLGMLAEVHLLSGQMQQAKRTIDRYWHRAHELGRDADQVRARLLYAEFCLQEGDDKNARKYAGAAADSAKLLGDNAVAAAAELLLGDIEREFGSVGAAKQHYQAAKELFGPMKDIDGARLVELGQATLVQWREQAPHVRHLLPRIVEHFQTVGNVAGHLRASLQLAWANFLHDRDRADTLQSLKSLRETAKRKQFAAAHAEAQMLIACVYRLDSDHKTANQEFRLARDLYAAVGRHNQPWPCALGDDMLPPAAAKESDGSR